MSAKRNSRSLRQAVEDFRTSFARKRSRARVSGEQRRMVRPGTPPDVQSVRAKSTGHGKVTADKWNQ
jgi:hypothetical protein